LVNLVANALKFTGTGSIRVNASLEESSGSSHLVRFGVADTGIGIAPEQQYRIFEAFTQGDGSTTRKYGGTGLGLTICSQLVHLMGGRIWVESEVGAGSVFHFTVGFGAGREGPKTDLTPRAEANARGSGAAALRVLLAEDNKVNQAVCVNLLRKHGHSVVVASNGVEAVAAFQRETFDVVLMDVQMPEMGGYEATAQIRQLESTASRHTPVIALTAHAMTGDRERALQAGMDGYVAKPISSAELFATMNSLCGGGAYATTASISSAVK
jgi:CheY-like chemotaxis protein